MDISIETNVYTDVIMYVYDNMHIYIHTYVTVYIYDNMHIYTHTNR